MLCTANYVNSYAQPFVLCFCSLAFVAKSFDFFRYCTYSYKFLIGFTDYYIGYTELLNAAQYREKKVLKYFNILK